MAREGVADLLDLRGLAGWTHKLLIAQAALSAVALGVAWIAGPGFDDEEGGSGLYMLVLLVQALLFIGAAILFLRWTYCASVNVRLLGAQGLGPSPGWAVGWYFVPIACLFMPFQAMKEIWKASVEPRDWEIVKAPALLGWWWTFWILSTIASTASWRLDMAQDMDGAGDMAEMLVMASDLANIPASLLLAMIVRRVTMLQGDQLAP